MMFLILLVLATRVIALQGKRNMTEEEKKIAQKKSEATKTRNAKKQDN